jgi:hypothetical protein
MLYRQSALWSGIGVKRPWCCIYRVVYGLMYGIAPIPDHRPLCLYNMVSSHQFHTWDQGPLSFYTTPWSLHTNSIHETRDHSQSMQHHGLFSPIPYISSYLVVYGLMYGISEKRPWCCIDRVLYGLELVWKDHDVVYTEWSMVSCMEFHTNLIHETIDHSVNSASWSLLTNSIHKTMDHSVYNTMVSSRQFHTWCCRQSGPWSHIWN